MAEKDKIKDLFTPSGCLSNQGLTRYIEERLDPEEKKLVELHIAGCELCADAVSGYRQHARPEMVIPEVHALNRQLHQRFLKIHSITRKERSMVPIFSVAATIILLAGIFLLLKQREIMTNSTIAQTDLDTVIAPADKSVRPAAQPESEYKAPVVKRPAATKEKKQEEMTAIGKSSVTEKEADLPVETFTNESDVVADKLEIQDIADALPEIITDSIVIHNLNSERAAKPSRSAGSSAEAKKSAYAKAETVLTAQEAASPADATSEEVFFVVDEMPAFMDGGINRFLQYVQENIIYPEAAAEAGIEGRVMLSFVVNEKGKLTDAKILRSADPLIDAEALRVVNSSPKWKPGMQRGKPVKVSFTVPIIFSLH